jgi:hypothetical protein
MQGTTDDDTARVVNWSTRGWHDRPGDRHASRLSVARVPSLDASS